VDQLEEIFTIDDLDAGPFIQALNALAHSGLVWIVATMRSDFYDRLETLPTLAVLAKEEACYRLLPPDDAELGQIIRQPAREAGLRFEHDAHQGESLDEMILTATSKNPGILPLLSFLLDKLWKRRIKESGTLTFAAYHELGELEGALGRHADDIYDTLQPDVQAALPRVLRALVTVGQNGIVAAARPVLYERFPEGSPERVFVAVFLEARLLVIDAERTTKAGARVRVAHEALLTHWGRAADWISERRTDLQLEERLEADAARWFAAALPDKPSLLRPAGLPLSEAEDLLRRRGDELTKIAISFIEMSTAAEIERQAGIREREVESERLGRQAAEQAEELAHQQARAAEQGRQLAAQRAHAAELSKAAAEERLGAARKLAVGAIAFGILTMVLVLMYFAKEAARNEMALSQKQAEVSLWIARSQSELSERRIAPAIQNAYRAFKELPQPASRSALLGALREVSPHLLGTVSLNGGLGQALTWVHHDNIALAVDRDFFWHALSNQGPLGPASPHASRPDPNVPESSSYIRSMQLIADGHLMIVLDDGRVSIITPGEIGMHLLFVPRTETVEPTGHAAAIGHTGSFVVAATTDAGVQLTKCNLHPEAGAAISCEGGPLTSIRARAVAISPDETRIVVGDAGGKLSIYDTSGKQIGSTLAIGAPIVSLSWAVSANLIAVGTVRGDIVIVDPISVKSNRPSSPSGISVSALNWSPVAADLAFACERDVVCVWRKISLSEEDNRSGRFIRLTGHTNTVTRISWSLDGSKLATLSVDGTMKIWSLEQNEDVGSSLKPCAANRFTTLATSPNSHLIAAGGNAGVICVWNSRTHVKTFQWPTSTAVRSLSWNANDRLAAAFEVGTVAIWSMDRDDPLKTIKPRMGEASKLTWAMNGQLIASLLRDDPRILFVLPDVADSQSLSKASSSESIPWGIAVHPDGSRLFVSYTDGTTGIWNLNTREMTATIPAAVDGDKMGSGSIGISPDGRWLATSGSNGAVMMYDLIARITSERLETEAKDTQVVGFSPNGRYVAALDAGGRLNVWTLLDGSWTLHLETGAIPARNATADPSGRSTRAASLSWVADDELAVATSSGDVEIISINEMQWQRRVEELHYDVLGQQN
jgi:WD40 repeat protein